MKNDQPTTVYDVIIIGGGPAGMSAAIYTSRSMLSTLVIDKNPNAGALATAHKIENYPGIPSGIPGSELLSIIRGQAESFGTKIVKGLVSGVNFESEPKEIYTNEDTFLAKSVIIATGSMGRKPTIAGEEKFRGRGVGYCATCDAAFYKDLDVAAAGELAEIVEEIDLIAKFARRVIVVARTKSIKPEEADILSRHPNIELRLGFNVKEIKGTENVTGLVIADPSGKDEEDIPAHGVFIYLRGNQPIVDFLYGAIEMKDGCIVLNNTDMSTSVKGVFAIGDVTCRKIRQAVISASEGCIAGLSAEQYLNRRERVRSQWSHP
jgi:thioredoxin reductase (NADPH)